MLKIVKRRQENDKNTGNGTGSGTGNYIDRKGLRAIHTVRFFLSATAFLYIAWNGLQIVNDTVHTVRLRFD